MVPFPGEKQHHDFAGLIARRILSKDPSKKPWHGKPRGNAPGRPHFFKRGAGSGKTPEGRDRRERRDGAHAADGPLRLFGMHAVEAALRNPLRKKNRLVLTENAEQRLIEAMGPLAFKFESVSPRDLDKILGPDAVHQGAMLETEDLPEPEFADLVENANGRPLIVLDQVTDPHNVGAILRSAAVFGAAGLVMTRRHSPPLNGVLAKSASGALELVPIALVTNLSRALEDLKEVGFHVIGLDGTAEARLEATDWSRPTALVMGAEGKGLRRLTAENCHLLVSITTDGPIDSLNVSNAAAIVLHTAALSRVRD